MIIKCQHRRKTMSRKKWELASRSSRRRAQVKASWTASHLANQTIGRIYSSQQQICSAMTNCNSIDRKINQTLPLPRKVLMSRLRSWSAATQYRTTSNKATISKQSSTEPTCSTKCTEATTCPPHFLAVTKITSCREATRKTNVVNSTSLRLRSKGHDKCARPPPASSGFTARALR